MERQLGLWQAEMAEEDPLCKPPRELFHEDELSRVGTGWWKANFFVREPVLFGTWDGVFTSVWKRLLLGSNNGIQSKRRLVGLDLLQEYKANGEFFEKVSNGNCGVLQALSVVAVALALSTTTVAAAVAVCSQCHLEGGVHALLSHVLGVRLGSAASLIYCLALAVGCALHLMGFAESLAGLLSLSEPWKEKLLALAAALLIFGINAAGVKWVVRVQLVLVGVLALGLVDFLAGLPRSGGHLADNAGPSYQPGESWATMLGVFYPAVTGVLAGINMASDLRQPSRSVSHGTFTALGCAAVVYLTFVLGLGASCTRSSLLQDFLVAEKVGRAVQVAALKVPLMAALYVSSASASLGALYSAPHTLQELSQDLPLLRILQRGSGRVPFPALALVTAAVAICATTAHINSLAPLATTAFLLAYAAVDYCHFSLAMGHCLARHPLSATGYGATSDMEQLFSADQQPTASPSPLTSPDEHSSVQSVTPCLPPTEQCTVEPESQSPGLWGWHWVSLLGALAKLTVAALVQWALTLGLAGVLVAFWIYVGRAYPAAPPGVSAFQLFPWLKNLFLRCLGCRPVDGDQIVVAPVHPGVEVTASQLTQDNSDYAGRQRFHHSTNIHFDSD
ncbi:SLC12A8 [Cordylochernes scorpioides]|uniref:SLC12A8 n=1 Tax=Cordylochernes scorpioides TaxID=51811 RepID=A0ABY6KEV5_9ARAC|nr:SLC12A8 [Cordylochernes scorpioides]